MRGKNLVLLVVVLLLLLTACASNEGSNILDENRPTASSENKESKVNEGNKEVISYPIIEDIEWSFVNGVLYGEPAVLLNYKNNTEFTIAGVHLSFKLKEDVTTEQLQRFDFLKEKWDITDEKIAELEPEVYDSKVCDPGEEITGASCDIYHSTPATDTIQCEPLELKYAEIIYIAEDNRLHAVAYSAENGGYSLMNMSEEPYEWSNSEYASMLPKPDTRIATVDYDEEDYFQCTAYDMNSEAFKAYTEHCKEKGFNIDVEESSYSFWGTHSKGYRLNVRFLSYDAIVISMEPEDVSNLKIDETDSIDNGENEEYSSAEENEDTVFSENLVDGMRPEFKEAMDSYEAFYTEYCDLLEQYMDDPTDLSLLAEYGDMLEKAEEMDEAFEAWDDGDMSNEEMKYYLEVTNRVMQKMLDVME